MSNISANSGSAEETATMLATSITPTAPHLLSRIALASSPSIFCSEDVRYLGSMSSPKRPKLSLQTSNLTPTFNGADGGPKTIMSLHTATPTRLNTFSNAFDLTYRPSPLSTVSSPTQQAQLRVSSHTCSPATQKDDTLYHLNLPFGVRPILKNTPLLRDTRRLSTCSASASPRTAGRRAFFPAPKNVRFRANLEEEIVTKVYVMRHADLSSSEDEIQTSETEESSNASTNEGDNDDRQRIIRVDEYAARGRRKRKTLTVSEPSSCDVDRGREERSRNTSALRSKRKRRRWEWTIKSVQPDLDVSSGDTLELTAESTASEHGLVVSRRTDIGDDTKRTVVTCGSENEAEALQNEINIPAANSDSVPT